MAMPPFVQKTSANQSVNYFSEGIRKGASIQVMPVYNLQAYQAQSQDWRNPGNGFGEGTIEGSHITYRINPCKGDIDYTAAPYTIAQTGIFTLSYALPGAGNTATVPFFNNATSQRAVQSITLNGTKQGILFDVPRGIGMKVTNLNAGTLTNVTATLTGVDIYGNPLVAQIAYSTSSTGVPSPWNGNDDADLAVAYTNCAFHILTEPPSVTWTGSGTPSVQFFAANFFGLPYYLADVGHVSSYSQFSNQNTLILNGTSQNALYIDESPQEQSFFPGAWAAVYGPGAAYANINIFPNKTSIPFYQTAVWNAAGTAAQFNNYGLVRGYPIESTDAPTISSQDVRGLFAPNTQFIQTFTVSGDTYETAFATGDSYRFNGCITIQYYSPGIDFYQNIQKNALQIYNIDPDQWVNFGKSNFGPTNPTQIPNLKSSIGVVPYSGSGS